MSARASKKACLGAFAGAHGVKGVAKIKTFTQSPENIAAYGPVISEDGARLFTLKLLKVLNDGVVLVSAPEIASREDAESLKGVRLYVDRDVLPAPDEDEFYLDDLVGLQGDVLELSDIPGVKGLRLVAFTRENVPVIDIAAARLTLRRGALNRDSDTPS